MLQIHGKQQSAPNFIPDFTNPMGLLVHCHLKIELQLGSVAKAIQLLRASDAELDPSVFQAIEGAKAHFAGPGVLHTADEEESLFPRIRRVAGPSDIDVLAALEELEAQHRTAEQAHARFDALVERMARNTMPSKREIDELDTCAGALATLYGPHMRLENEVIFPAGSRLLPPDELLAVGQEMRERRKAWLR